jgi:hypothetical protein
MARISKEEKAMRDKLIEFIYSEYEITTLPKYFFANLAKIYNGTYSKNLKEPIPVEDLYNMWQKKMDFLNKTYEYNMQHGKEMYGTQRIAYDLAILINKYDSYKRWKAKQNAIHEQEKSYVQQQAKIRIVKPKIQVPEDDDISDIIDEI